MDEGTQEKERKFIVYDVADDGDRFRRILYDFIDTPTIENYTLRGNEVKRREFRYFDTFEGELIGRNLSSLNPRGILEQGGFSASLRKREMDSVLTIKIPISGLYCSCEEGITLRDEREFPIPLSESAFEEVNLIGPHPRRVEDWPQFRLLKLITKNMPLQDVVRLSVETYRTDIYSEDRRKLEIAFDMVKVQGIMRSETAFYEVEIEVKEDGKDEDLERIISSPFFRNYTEYLKISTLPKWIKAIKLLRGERLFSD